MRLLRSPDFRLLALSNGLSSLGDELALVALTIKVFELSDGSGIAVAAVLLAGVIPLVVFAPLAGLIVDRTETTGTLALASVAQALIAVGLAFAEPVWLVVALSFLLGSAASIASPAVFAIVPTAVGEEDLTEANATMETVRYIGMVAGPLIAGGLAGALGATGAPGPHCCWTRSRSWSSRRPPRRSRSGAFPRRCPRVDGRRARRAAGSRSSGATACC